MWSHAKKSSLISQHEIASIPKIYILLFACLHIITLICCACLIIRQVNTDNELSDLRRWKEYMTQYVDKSLYQIHSPRRQESTSSNVRNHIVQNRTDIYPEETNSRGRRQAAGTSNTCGDTVYISRQRSGNVYTLQSPNYPAPYDMNLTCQWNFVLALPQPNGYSPSTLLINDVSLRISFIGPIDIESHPNCIYDWIEIRGGGRTGPLLLPKTCGVNRTIDDIEFNGPLYVLFKSDHIISRNGFRATVSVITSNPSIALASPQNRISECEVIGASDATSITPRPAWLIELLQALMRRQTENVAVSPGIVQDGNINENGIGNIGNGNNGNGNNLNGNNGNGDNGNGNNGNGDNGNVNNGNVNNGHSNGNGNGNFNGNGAGINNGNNGGNQASSDVTYTVWGKFSCKADAKAFYDGYAAGFANSAGSQSLKCVPFPPQLSCRDKTLSSFPSLTPARFNLRGVTDVLTTDVDNKLIRCAFCHASSKNEIFTVIGWKNCNTHRDWQTLYSGILMAVLAPGKSTSSLSSDPICIENSPVSTEGYGADPTAPQLTFVQSGTGLWFENKIIPCAVCIK